MPKANKPELITLMVSEDNGKSFVPSVLGLRTVADAAEDMMRLKARAYRDGIGRLFVCRASRGRTKKDDEKLTALLDSISETATMYRDDELEVQGNEMPRWQLFHLAAQAIHLPKLDK